MKKVILLLSILLAANSIFAQVFVSDSIYYDSFPYTGITPKNPIKINDSTICFILYADNTITDYSPSKIICCDKNINVKWMVKDSSNYIFSQAFYYDKGLINYYSFQGYPPYFGTPYYARLTLDENGNKISKYVAPNNGTLYGFTSPVIVKIDSGCLIMDRDYPKSRITYYDESDSMKWRKYFDTVKINMLSFANNPIFFNNKIYSIGPVINDTTYPPETKFYFLRTDLSGNIEVKKIYTGINNYCSSFGGPIQINDNLFVHLCCEENPTTKFVKSWLIFFNQNGDSLRRTTFGLDSGKTTPYKVRATQDGNLLVCGYYLANLSSYNKFYLAKFDTNGKMLWSKIWGSSKYDEEIRDFIEMDKNEYILLGSSYGTDTVVHFYKAVIYDGPNSIKETVAQESELKISPNPAGNTLKIENASDYDKIEIFDIRGELVATFSSAQELDISRLSAGAYNIKAYAGGKMLKGRFVKK